ncbi:MAG: protease SohB [Desulfococcaceae bacterium]|nr:protease SohB [Desulfococcaceae bacterium]
MKDFLYKSDLFLAKTLSIAVSVLLVIFTVMMLIRKQEGTRTESIHAEKLNDKYESMRLDLEKHILDEDAYEASAEKAEKKREKKKKQVFVLNFKGDISASAVRNLREEITALLSVADREDEVILRLESFGGLVHSYGLATSQLQRIKDRNIPLTVAVDNAAASGGYMMACVADHLVAAPYAIIGSIGIIIAMPNFHRFLEKHGIDYEQITAGEYKRTV